MFARHVSMPLKPIRAEPNIRAGLPRRRERDFPPFGKRTFPKPKMFRRPRIGKGSGPISLWDQDRGTAEAISAAVSKV